MKLFQVKHYASHFFVGLKDGKMIWSRKEKDLDKTLAELRFQGPKQTWEGYYFYLALCDSCKEPHTLDVEPSKYYVTIARKSKNCEEYNFLHFLGEISEELGWAVVKNKPHLIERAINKLSDEEIKAIPSHIWRKLPLDSLTLNKVILAKVE